MTPGPRKITLILAVLASAVAPAIPARAFERGTVEGDPTTLLAWPTRELELRIADDTSADVGAPDLRAAVLRSFATWTGAGACTDIALVDDGAVRDLRTNLMGGAHDGENSIVFREEDWPAELGPETLAITTVVYRRSTGEILDGDIDVNGLDHAWSVTDVPIDGANDVENTITHELGHFLGFAHVTLPDATMFAESEPGDVVKRDLAADDLLAICTVYPSAGTTPGGRFPRPALTGGCSTSAPRAALPLTWLALVALALSLRRRRGS